MTIDELDAIKKRLAAAMKCDDWGPHGTKELTFTPEKPGRNAAIWYGDGDQCAEVHGNLGLGIDGDAVGEFFAKSIGDVTKLVAEVTKLNLQVEQLQKIALAASGVVGYDAHRGPGMCTCDFCTRLRCALTPWAEDLGKKEKPFTLPEEKPVCRELNHWGHADVFECGQPLPCATHKRKYDSNEHAHTCTPLGARDCPHCGNCPECGGKA